MKKKLFLLALFALPLLAISHEAIAGTDWTASYPGYCVTNSNGSYCYGTMSGNRSSSDSTRWALFAQNSSGSLTFSATYSPNGGNSSWSCTAPSSMQSIWNVAMNARGYYYIQFGADAVCSYLYVSAGSAYNSAN